MKVEPEQPPPTIPADHDLKPSQIASWPGPGGSYGRHQSRTAKENEWFQATGKVVQVRSTYDGDFHIELVDAEGTSNATVIVEVPRGKVWEGVRHEVARLCVKNRPVIRVIGKAFYDAEHAKGNTTGNRRAGGNVAVWEIHPVMKLEILSN